jgi:integrase
VPRSWSEAKKQCKDHPRKINGRWCSCRRAGWRYRMGLPDPATGAIGRPEWSRTFPTKEAADEHQHKTRKAIAERSYTSDRGMTVEAFLTEWVERKKAKRKTTTAEGYESIVEHYLIPYLGRHRLGNLLPDHVQAMLTAVEGKPSLRRKKPVTAGTIRNIRACLRTALNEAIRRGLVSRNVANMVEMPTVKRPKPVAVDAERLSRFLAHVEGDWLYALWLLDAIYGARRGELVGLRRQDVDLKAKVIRIEQELILTRKGGHTCPHCGEVHGRLLFDDPKSRAGERVLPLVPQVEAALAAHLTEQNRQRKLFAGDYSDHGLLFAMPDGRPLSPDYVSAAFKRHLVAAGVIAEGERPPPLKTLRSSMVTSLHEGGAQLEVISAAAGHTEGGVTRDHYLKVNAERSRAPFEALAASLTPRRSDRHSDQHQKTVSETSSHEGLLSANVAVQEHIAEGEGFEPPSTGSPH